MTERPTDRSDRHDRLTSDAIEAIEERFLDGDGNPGAFACQASEARPYTDSLRTTEATRFLDWMVAAGVDGSAEMADAIAAMHEARRHVAAALRSLRRAERQAERAAEKSAAWIDARLDEVES